MKLMKKVLNDLSWKDGNIFERVTKLRESLKESQTEVDKHPHCEIVKEKSCKLLNEYYEALKDKSNMFMQKAKVDWLKDGDRNTKFFHKIIKSRMHKGRIMFVCNEKGDRFENDKVAEQFVKHFQEFLGKKDVITKNLKNAMFDIDDNKAPRPDGYTIRLKGVLGNLVHESQSAFIAGRQISDNILLAHELFKWYNRKQNARKVAFKIDLQKAYDTISWDFIEVVLKQFGFPKKMVDWIMVCVSTTKFSININGEREGYFIVLNIISILGIVPFAIGKLPVRYLGVPLITKKISSTDCKPLIDKVKNRVLDWRNKALSYSGRLQLISSVLSAMQIYWASVFLLPKNVIYETNKILKGFLWCQGELTKGKAKIS
ncbi:RNA-directed DNA polymerase, eukaryota, reverse transcriptase zinc-binding domain protein [Tanacetum coccineum]